MADRLPTIKGVDIIRHVAEFYDLNPNLFNSERRVRGLAHARQVAMWIMEQVTNKSYPEMGLIFRKDHSTIRYAVKAVNRRRGENPEYREETDSLLMPFISRRSDAVELRPVFSKTGKLTLYPMGVPNVRGYTNRYGTYVQGYYRSSPDVS